MIPIHIDCIKIDLIKKEFIKMVKAKIIDGRKNIVKETIRINKVINNELKKLKISNSLEDIILADFKTLTKIKEIFDSTHNTFDAYEGSETGKKYIKGSPYNSLYKAYDKLDNNWLIKELGVTVCPYCNRDFINNRGSSTSAQLDHFYPRSKYPILLESQKFST